MLEVESEVLQLGSDRQFEVPQLDSDRQFEVLQLDSDKQSERTAEAVGSDVRLGRNAGSLEDEVLSAVGSVPSIVGPAVTSAMRCAARSADRHDVAAGSANGPVQGCVQACVVGVSAVETAAGQLAVPAIGLTVKSAGSEGCAAGGS